MANDTRINVTMRYSEAELAALDKVAAYHGLERAHAVRMLITHELRRIEAGAAIANAPGAPPGSGLAKPFVPERDHVAPRRGAKRGGKRAK